ncbi:MAG TPA: hypothetical protein PLT46_11505 [Burkholderiaceae bacterium]|jgi:hypothetical protein|nr:hypothetical protein [Burkholderiaceae bacterium]
MTLALAIAVPLLAVYGLFLLWYGGHGKPMTQSEIDHFMKEVGALVQDDAVLQELRSLVASDDGKEFVMQNLVRYRPKALYPPGYDYGDDPRAADRRYGKAVIGPLLRHGSLILFVAKRSGVFIEPEGADAWHYVAMVRYRSRRDFLRFALATQRDDIFVHKWAALEKTHVFPVKPLVSLVFVRATVAGLLALSGGALFLHFR